MSVWNVPIFLTVAPKDLAGASFDGAMTLDATGCCQFTNSAGASGTKGFYRLLGQ